MLGVRERDVNFAASAGPYEKGHEGAQASNPSQPHKSSTTGGRKYLLDLLKASKRPGAKERAKIGCLDDLTVCSDCARTLLHVAEDPNRPSSVGSYLGPSLASCFLISGLSYKTTFNSELWISIFPLYSI